MTSCISEKRGHLEDAILRSMYLKCVPEVKRKPKALKNGRVREFMNPSQYVRGKAEFPKDAIIFDACDDSRLYGRDADTTLLNPADVLDGLEVIIFYEDRLKWLKYVRTGAPRGLAAINSRRVKWFAAHYRESHPDGYETYVREPFALHADDGSAALLKYLAWRNTGAVKNADETNTNVRLAVSIYEDSVRAGSYTATVEEHIKLRFPVSADSYLDFLRLRDGFRDTPTGRKNPLLHWCAKHLRNYKSGRTTVVKQHARGRAELTVGPMRLSLSYNDGSALTGKAV